MQIPARYQKAIVFILVTLFAVTVAGFLYYQHTEAWRHTFHVTFFDIGQGDGALINFTNGETMLVDCGPDKKVLSKLGKALPFYVRAIDTLLVTHEHVDHYGGCVDVLRRYQVKHIVMNGDSAHDAYYQAWDAAARAEGVDITTVQAPQTWTIASSTILFLAPSNTMPLEKDENNPNNHSIVFKLTANTGKTFLFTGDMENVLEWALMQSYCSPSSTTCPTLESTVLKVGHHGSNSSSGEDFLALVHPQTAVISVGKNNKFGHPSLRTVKHLERAGAQVLRTDEMGDIVVK